MVAHNFKITEGCLKTGQKIACNQSSDAKVASPNIPSAAEVAEKAMREVAAKKAAQEDYRRAKEAAKGKTKNEPQRWLSNEDLA